MAREFAKRFYASKEWLRCRASYIAERQAIDGGMCETCHERPGYIVHHTVWLTPENINDLDVALNHKLLRYDCLVCHNKEEERENAEPERYRFGEDGDVLPVAPPSKRGVNDLR